LSERTIRRYVSDGSLPARKAGARVLIREMDLDLWWRTLEPCGGAGEPLTVAVSTHLGGR
jgi:excisionase family DNA binding protein